MYPTLQRLIEAKAKAAPVPTAAPKVDPDNVEYSEVSTGSKVTKIVANLKSYDSARYTRLARNLMDIEARAKELEELRKTVKSDARELVADLFRAQDACYTRVINTVNFTFQLSKDPGEVRTPKYAKILEELEKHLTPALRKKLEELKDEFVTIVDKSPSLRVFQGGHANELDTTEESLREGVLDTIKSFVAGLMEWLTSYDKALKRLERFAGL